MSRYENRIITLNDYIHCIRNGRHYIGYVEGIGYAYTSARVAEPKTTRHTYAHNQIYYECKLEMSKDTILRFDKSNVFQEKESVGRLSGRIIRISLAASGALLADDVAGIGVADDPLIIAIAVGAIIILTVAYFIEGNSHYPGPWSTTKPAPLSPQSVPQGTRPPLPDPHIPQSKGWLVPGAAVLLDNTREPIEHYIKNKRAIEMVNRPHYDRQSQNSLMANRLRQLSKEFEKQSTPARDATRVEINRRLPNERK